MHLELQPSCGASRTELPVGKSLGTPVAVSPRLSLSLGTGQPDTRGNPPDYSNGTPAKACKGTNSPDCAHHGAQKFSQTRHPECPDPEPKTATSDRHLTRGRGDSRTDHRWPLLETTRVLPPKPPPQHPKTKMIFVHKILRVFDFRGGHGW